MNGDEQVIKAELIPDFVKEFIGRIIPGLVTMALYMYWSGSGFTVAFSTTILSATILAFVFILVAAWIIGVTLDLGVYLIVYNAGRKICPKRLEKMGNFTAGLGEWYYLSKTNSWERGYLIKDAGQVVFLRSMGFICALTASVSLMSILKFPSGLNFWLPALFNYNWLYFISGLAFCLVFWCCWWMNYSSHSKHVQKLCERLRDTSKCGATH
jgi:hypothetical protein